MLPSLAGAQDGVERRLPTFGNVLRRAISFPMLGTLDPPEAAAHFLPQQFFRLYGMFQEFRLGMPKNKARAV